MDIGIKMSKKTKVQGLIVPWETADQITVTSLKEHRGYLSKELKKWNKNPKTDDNPDGFWLHPDDVANHAVLINHMDAIINYYGE
jgi:hypothetical protein